MQGKSGGLRTNTRMVHRPMTDQNKKTSWVQGEELAKKKNRKHPLEKEEKGRVSDALGNMGGRRGKPSGEVDSGSHTKTHVIEKYDPNDKTE